MAIIYFEIPFVCSPYGKIELELCQVRSTMLFIRLIFDGSRTELICAKHLLELLRRNLVDFVNNISFSAFNVVLSLSC